MKIINIKNSMLILLVIVFFGCVPQKDLIRQENKNVPSSYTLSTDSVNVAKMDWKQYFDDENLVSLIDTALSNNQELNMILQEIEISQNEVLAHKGEYMPFVRLGAGLGMEKEGRFTRLGSVEHNLEVAPGRKFPEPYTDYMVGAFGSWELDVWKKLRNAKKSAALRYLSEVEGRNFMVTSLIAEISEAYYELMALDNLLAIIEQNIVIQSNALKVVQLQKESAKLTELAVNRFEAQLLNTKNLQYVIRQNIVENENRINFLTGRFPAPITRSSERFMNITFDSIQAGVPSQLLVMRPDIRKAELALEAAKVDVQVARASFYPSFGIRGGVGFQAFNPAFLVKPESILFNLVGDAVAPLINRNAIIAAFNTANAKQIQAMYQYEQTILSAYVDVLNQMSRMDNFSKSYEMKNQEVEILKNSITIANSLFNYARADYAEVLFTQREALESKMELIEIKLKQVQAKINIYRALGGGWNEKS